MQAVMVYDNASAGRGFVADWGFACVLEAFGKKILFDTGADGRILMHNMEACGEDAGTVDFVFISHGHWDHTGGLEAFRNVHKCPVYAPVSALGGNAGGDFIPVSDALELDAHLYSTGELGGIEQSLVIEEEGHLYVVAGCSHPGVGTILDAASKRGTVQGLLGGLHGCRDFARLATLDWVCATHCTQFQDEMKQVLGTKLIPGGVGRRLAISGKVCRAFCESREDSD